MRNLLIIMSTVWIEYIRRKDFYVVLILAAVFALLALGVQVIGVRSADEAFFLMSFGLTLAYLLSGCLTIILASRQIPREFEHRTIYPLLARPLSRLALMAGKILGVSLIGAGTLLILTLLVYLPTPKSSEQSLGTLAQVIGIQMVSLALLATFTCGISLYLPPAITALLTFGLFFASGGAVRAMEFLIRDLPAYLQAPSLALLKVIPDFSIFDHIPRFVEGVGPFQWGELLILSGYGVVLIALYFMLGAMGLSRKQL